MQQLAVAMPRDVAEQLDSSIIPAEQHIALVVELELVLGKPFENEFDDECEFDPRRWGRS